MHREAGRPIPQLSDDPVIDYMVLEALALKIRKEDDDAAKKDEKQQWKGDLDELRKHA